MTQSNIYTRRSRKKCPIDLFVFFLFFAFSFLGFTGEITNYIKLALFLLWIITLIIIRKGHVLAVFARKEVFLLFLFVVFFLFSSSFAGDAINTLKYTAMYFMQFGAVICYYAYKDVDESTFKIIKTVCFVIIIIVTINAILFYIVFPSAARILAANSSAFDNIAIGNGYSLAYSITILAVFILYYLINGVLTVRRPIYFLLVVLFSVAVFLTESTTTLLALFFGFFTTVLFRIIMGESFKKHSPDRIRLGFFIIILLIIIVALTINSFGEWLVSSTDSHLDILYVRRLNRIGQKLAAFGTNNSVDNYVDERFSTIVMSVKTFFEHPLLGVGYQYGNIYSQGYYYGVGQHSEFMDILAQFGLFGFFTLMIIYFSFIRKCNSRKHNYGVVVTILVLCIFNPFMSFQGCFIVFFFVPLLSRHWNRNSSGSKSIYYST